MNFKEWFIINESKEEKDLALELAGSDSVLSSLNEVIPQNKKDSDKLLLLAAYYYSKTKDLQQIKTDMQDYIGFLRNNRMPLITVDLTTKEPPSPWKDYIHWIEVIHGHQGEDEYRTRSASMPTDMDFQGEPVFLKSPDERIKVYKGHSPQQCIILGKGQTFCISKPGNTDWQGYRDRNVSTFYFVYDETRDDRLSIVVVDARPNKIVLTDKVNKTGTTLNPYTNELTTDSSSYMRYLREKGIDISKFENIGQSEEEKAEHKKLGNQKENLDWFKSLTYQEKSKYIGRGHALTDKQFDYLWDNNFNTLLSQYVKTGLKLNNYQFNKVITKRDLKDSYLHNRMNADDLSKEEFDLLNDKQKEKALSSLKGAIKFGTLEDVKKSVDKGAIIGNNAVSNAALNGNLDVIKYLVEEKGAYIGSFAVQYAAEYGHLDVVKYLVEKGAEIRDAVNQAARNGHLDVVKYLVEKGAEIGKNAVEYAAYKGHLDIIKYLLGDEVELNGERIKLPDNIRPAFFGKNAVLDAAEYGHLNVVKYLVEKGAEITVDAVELAAKNGHLDVVKYLVEKGAEIGKNAVELAAKNGHLDVVKYLVEKYIGRGHKLSDKQFDYLWENNFTTLLSQYVKIGFKLNDHQFDKIITNRDLRDSYLHNRLIADQHKEDISKKEFDLLNDKQKEKALSSLKNAIQFGTLENVKKLIDKGERIGENAVSNAALNGNLDIVKYLVEEKGAEIGEYAVAYVAKNGHLDVVKYLVEKGAEIGYAINQAAYNGHLDVIKYLLGEEVELNGERIKLPYNMVRAFIGKDAVLNAAEYGHLDVVKYLVGKGARITVDVVEHAAKNGHLDVVKYLVEKGAEIGKNAVEYAAYWGHLDVVKYLVEKGAEIGQYAVTTAVANGYTNVAEYLKKEIERRKE